MYAVSHAATLIAVILYAEAEQVEDQIDPILYCNETHAVLSAIPIAYYFVYLVSSPWMPQTNSQTPLHDAAVACSPSHLSDTLVHVLRAPA